jgi:Rrf2 family protein
MLSRTSEYALRAMVCLVRHIDDWPISGKRIAEETGIPAKYQSNILSSLVRAGVLISSPGIGGGFAMVRSPQRVSLEEILKPFEAILGPTRPCPFGNEVCNDADPCAGHERWKHVKEVFAQFLQDTTIHDVSAKHAGACGFKKRKRP